MIEKLQLMPWLVILTLCIEADTRKILIPKIEINMMLQELSSQEAKDFMKKSQNTSNSDSINNSTLSSEDADDSSTDLISSVVSVPPESSDAVTTPDSSDFNEPEAVTPSRPMMLSEFASHLAGGIRQRVETTTLPLPEFPTPKSSVFSVLPDDTFPDMVAEAKVCFFFVICCFTIANFSLRFTCLAEKNKNARRVKTLAMKNIWKKNWKSPDRIIVFFY